MPASWAIAASASMSSTSHAGLPTVSAYRHFVSSRIAARHASRSPESTNVTSMPILRNVTSNCWNVPP
jgi:hypothetical protein